MTRSIGAGSEAHVLMQPASQIALEARTTCLADIDDVGATYPVLFESWDGYIWVSAFEMTAGTNFQKLRCVKVMADNIDARRFGHHCAVGLLQLLDGHESGEALLRQCYCAKHTTFPLYPDAIQPRNKAGRRQS